LFEVAAHCLRRPMDLKLPDGRDRAVRHGHGPGRAVQTGVGPVEVRCAKVRDRGDVSTGEKIRFTSSILRDRHDYKQRCTGMPSSGLEASPAGDGPSARAGEHAPQWPLAIGHWSRHNAAERPKGPELSPSSSELRTMPRRVLDRSDEQEPT
jgi:hypothetical protein